MELIGSPFLVGGLLTVMAVVMPVAWTRFRSARIDRAVMTGITKNSYLFSGGGEGPDFFDLDAMLFSEPESISAIADAYTEKIKDLASVHDVQVLVFIEKDSGPVGALTLLSLLVLKTGIPSAIVRLRRRLITSQVKAAGGMRPGTKVVLISDIATGGRTLMLAATILQKRQLDVVGAIVLVDREQGAEKDLLEVGIPLVAIKTRLEYEKATSVEPNGALMAGAT